MEIDLFALRAFVRVAEESNFSKAALALHVSPSRLTRLTQALERQVGARLFARSTHGTVLTAEGGMFLPSARRIVAEADWASRRLTRHRTGGSAVFTVGCQSGTLYDALPQRVRAARLAYPQQQIRVVEMDEPTITQQVLDGSIDVGFLYFPTADDDVEARIVVRRAHWVAMATDHPLASRASLSIRDLAGQTLILPDENLAPRLHRWYRSFLDKGGRRTFKYISVNQIHVALGLCAAGEGLCVVVEHLRRMRADDLHYVPLPEAPSTELSAIWRRDSPVRQIAQFLARW